jgi:hypothetical protein
MIAGLEARASTRAGEGNLMGRTPGATTGATSLPRAVSLRITPAQRVLRRAVRESARWGRELRDNE